MLSLEDRLVAGLEALDYVETASAGPWRRFGKFRDRMAFYVMPGPNWAVDQAQCRQLWFSNLHVREPQDAVTGMVYEQVLAAGDASIAKRPVDTETLLCELMYKP